MDEQTREAFRQTGYHVNLDLLRWATLGVGSPLPHELAVVVGARPWAFITAWNPQACPRPAADNLAAQESLLAALRSHAGVDIYPGIGVGRDGWNEPSLFVVGIDTDVMDTLATQHRQLAYLHGSAGAVVLRELA
jgi:hypothetical protein